MGIITSIKGVMQRMSLIKEIKGLQEIGIEVDGYEKINAWQAIYQGDAPWLDYQLNNGGCIQNIRMKSLNMARVACSELAKKIWSEKCSINIDDKALNEYVEEVLKENNFDVKNTQFLESAFALGGGCYNPYIDADTGNIMIDFTQANNFIPLKWNNLTVTEGVFIDHQKKNGKYYTLITKHTFEDGVYKITNNLYQSLSKDTLGIWVPLGTLYQSMEDEVVNTDIDKPLFSYFKPNINNNLLPSSPLGISIFANSEDTLKILDEIYDSWYKEFKLGGKKITLSNTFLDIEYDNSGNRKQTYDLNRNVFLGLNTQGEESPLIRDDTIQIRLQEHVDGIKTQLDLLSMQTGFSSGTFSFDGGMAVTATEVVSKQQTTYHTMVSHELILEQCIENLVNSIIVLGISKGDIPTSYSSSNYKINVKFDDSIITDENTDIDNNIKLTSSGLKPKYKAIMDLFGIDEAEARKWVEEINSESRSVTPVDMFSNFE